MMEIWPLHLRRRKAHGENKIVAMYFHHASGFCHKVADIACEELSMVNDEDKRGAYADDVAERTRNEAEASASLQEFEAAAAFTGLGLNVGKTEALGSRIKKAVASEEAENAMKELVQVSVDGTEVRGWMTQAKWRAELGIEQWNDEEAKGKMVIKLDDGEEWMVEVRGVDGSKIVKVGGRSE